MKFSILTPALALISTATAVATSQQSYGGQHSQCLTTQEAHQWLQSFLGVFGKTDPNRQVTANRIIADQFAEYSNSILSLQGKPLNGQPAASSKQQWIQGVLNAPTVRGIETKDVIVGCDKIVWYWSFQGVGAAIYQTNGFNIFHMVRRGKQLQSNRFDIEFDSIAWGLNTGLGVTYRNGTKARGSGPPGA